MKIVPITLKTANEFVKDHHRHHKPVVGHKFSIGLSDYEQLIGVAICGRPVARGADTGFNLEVTRLVTIGTPNACSKLYGACARIAKEMGYSRIQTYILSSEIGTSLKASGWTMETITKGGQWLYKGGKLRRMDQPTEPKQRWAKYL